MHTELAIAGLHRQSSRHFLWQPSLRVSRTLRPSCLSHMTARTTLKRRILAPPLVWLQKTTNPRAHDFAHTRDISLDSLALPTPATRGFVELILVYIHAFIHVLTTSKNSLLRRVRKEAASNGVVPCLPSNGGSWWRRVLLQWKLTVHCPADGSLPFDRILKKLNHPTSVRSFAK